MMLGGMLRTAFTTSAKQRKTPKRPPRSVPGALSSKIELPIHTKTVFDPSKKGGKSVVSRRHVDLTINAQRIRKIVEFVLTFCVNEKRNAWRNAPFVFHKTIADHDGLTPDRKRGQHDVFLMRLSVVLQGFKRKAWEGRLIEIKGLLGSLFNRNEGAHVPSQRVLIVEFRGKLEWPKNFIV